MEHGHFTHEKLQVWRVAREALALQVEHKARLKGLPGDLPGQLEWALVSVVANIAEGAGRESRADRRRHYVIARGSANEAGALVDIITLYRTLPDEAAHSIRSRLIRVVQMLNVMIGK